MRRILFLWTPAVLVALPLLFWLVQPWPILLQWREPGQTAYMKARVQEARAAGRDFEVRKAWVPLDDLPRVLVRAVLVAEDDRFYDHGGIDWEALAEEVRYRGPIPPNLRDPADREALRAAWAYAQENRDRLRGRSTLTQQLARNLYLAERRSFFRKGQEFIVARRLEAFLTKDRILELYLNTVELGDGIFGVEAAAQTYFGRSARDLTRSQAASLAATLPHPRTSNPAHRPSRMEWRRDLILQRLGGGGSAVPPPEALVPEPPLLDVPAVTDAPVPDVPVPDVPVPDVPGSNVQVPDPPVPDPPVPDPPAPDPKEPHP
jgi:monofunctional biosynthetic peptidoglycan transglycosylase